MTYDLLAIVRQSGKRVRHTIRMRGHTLTQERQLAFIFRKIVAHWRMKARTMEPRMVVAADAIPDPGQFAEAGAEADLVVAALVKELQAWAARSAEWVRLTWAQRVKAETGIDVRMLATSQIGHEQLVLALEWATALLRDLSDQTRSRLANALYEATLRGALEAEAQAIVQDVLATAEKRAKLIAHDQTQKIIAKLNELQQREAGVTEYIWQHSFLPNARRHHVERQGNRYRWDKPPRGGHPGTEINCRCTAAAVLGE